MTKVLDQISQLKRDFDQTQFLAMAVAMAMAMGMSMAVAMAMAMAMVMGMVMGMAILLSERAATETPSLVYTAGFCALSVMDW